ncbi:hypothetical protein FHR92_003946 [Fontibacillus solani]|uniref:Uncharacterized protein n=1 Tax=Fontibacillus solani TaxID=1572857 RepID=A0A7W3SWC9_9BACL|nr:hypothetical protein [Fontibacillus solani]MBA9087461.1 hypothetical protein [Fontibacillus solani]
MIEHGKVKSTIEPEPITVDEHSVWVCSNIVPVEEISGEDTFSGFEYDMVQYSKDEYIKIINDKNQSLEAQLTDVQLALVEIYEGMM